MAEKQIFPLYSIFRRNLSVFLMFLYFYSEVNANAVNNTVGWILICLKFIAADVGYAFHSALIINVTNCIYCQSG